MQAGAERLIGHPGLAGAVSLAAGLGTGHAASALVAPGSSPVIALANRIVDATPTPVKEWAVATLGAGDKAVLILGIGVVAVVLGGLVGVLAARSQPIGLASAGALAAVCAAAALADPTASALWVVPALVAWLTGAAFLVVLVPRQPVLHPSSGPALSRRRLFATAAGGGVAVVGLGAGEAFQGAAVPDVPVPLPVPADPLPPPPVGLEAGHRGLAPLFTPVADFYRVDTSLSPPRLAHTTWRLQVDGDVTRPLDLDWDALLAHEVVERDITMLCVSNPVGGPYISTARWLGVRVRDVLAEAGPGAASDMVLSTAVDGFTISTPLAALTDGRDALFAVAMNGQPLPRQHGAPVRLVTPGLYGYVGSTKWVTRLTVTRFDRADAYWTIRGWAARGPIKPGSRIDVPRPGTPVPTGPVVLAGVAWAQRIGVATVELRVDGGPWSRAALGPDAGIDVWRQWTFGWEATPGEHTVEVRLVDARGQAQDAGPADPFPDGAAGYHRVTYTVR